MYLKLPTISLHRENEIFNCIILSQLPQWCEFLTLSQEFSMFSSLTFLWLPYIVMLMSHSVYALMVRHQVRAIYIVLLFHQDTFLEVELYQVKDYEHLYAMKLFLFVLDGRDHVTNQCPPGGAVTPENCPLVANAFVQTVRLQRHPGGKESQPL